MNRTIFYIFLPIAFIAAGIYMTPSSAAGWQITAAAKAAPAKPAPETKAPAAPKVTKEVCLECHGPFEKLTTAPVTFTAENGEKTNPHRYVPHDRKDMKSIPECTRCHKLHQIPPESKPDVPKASGEWCYSCHHMREFTPCSACHHD